MASFTLQAACVMLGETSRQHHQQIRMVHNLFSNNNSSAAAAGSTAEGNSSHHQVSDVLCYLDTASVNT